MTEQSSWQRFQRYWCQVPELDLTLDVSRMHFGEDFLARMREPLRRAFEAIDDLERGAIANPDEDRMVGHDWLRAPDRPTPRRRPRSQPKSARRSPMSSRSRPRSL